MGLFGPPDIERLKRKKKKYKLVSLMIRNNDNDIGKAAIDALGEIGKPAISPLTDIFQRFKNDEKVCDAAAEALSKIGEPAVEPLISILLEYDFQRYAIKYVKIALGRIGVPAIDRLIDGIGNDNQDVQQLCIETLGLIKDHRAVDALENALENHKLEKRTILALSYTGTIGYKVLENHLNSIEPFSPRWFFVLENLAKIRDTKVIQTLFHFIAIAQKKSEAAISLDKEITIGHMRGEVDDHSFIKTGEKLQKADGHLKHLRNITAKYLAEDERCREPKQSNLILNLLGNNECFCTLKEASKQNNWEKFWNYLSFKTYQGRDQ